MYVYLYDNFLRQKKYDSVLKKIETKLTDYGIAGKIIRLQNFTNAERVINDEINSCSSNEESLTSWGEKCNSVWTSEKIVSYVLSNIDLKNPYSINKPLIQTSQDPRIQAEGKAGQSTDKGIIFVSSNNFESEAGSEWVVGTCVKSPCVAAGNNELVSVYR